MLINLSTFNFKDVRGIKQIVNILKFYFRNNISVVKKIKEDSTQIFIENFTKDDVEKIIKFKKKKNIKIILLLTEFFENDTLNQDSNILLIEKPLNIFVFFLKLFNYGLFLKIKQFIKYKLDNIFFIVKKKYYRFFSRNIHYFSMRQRLKNLEKLMPYIDLFLVTHPKIKKELKKKYKINSTVLIPILPKIKKNYSKENKVKFSGLINEYRYNKISKFNYCVYNFNKYFKNNLIETSKSFFLDIDSNKKFKFSLHLKKDNKWTYDSPFRYFYSIINNEIPIVMDNFSNKNNKLITFKLNNLNKLRYLKILKNYSTIVSAFNRKICKFNYIAKKNELKFKTKLKTLMR